VSRLARWVPLASVVTLLGLAMLAATFANPRIDVLPPPPPPTAPDATTSPLDETTAPPTISGTPGAGSYLAIDLPPAVLWILAGLCLLVVLVVLGVLVRLLFQDRIGQRQIEMIEPELPPTEEETEQTVRAAVDAGLEELDDGDPRQAVIACWVRLEAAAAAAGTERSPGDTSTELVTRLLARHYVSAPVLAALAEVYREARFARHPVDEATREQARTALRQLRDELSAGARHGD
jgi:Domain of unknown function (DUF4129)